MFDRTLLNLACGIAVSGCLATATQAQEAPVSVEVFPADVHLNTLRDRQSFVVQATYANGITRDVTTDNRSCVPGIIGSGQVGHVYKITVTEV